MIQSIDLFLSSKKLSGEAINEVVKIRKSDPARKVRSGGKNVPGTYPSKKMGFTIQFESHTLELAGIIEKEMSSNVLEFYDQPPSFKIDYLIKGTKKGHLYTSDFFVIEENWIGWEEWKTEEELIKLSMKWPNRYSVDEFGVWRCPPAEKYAEKYGLSFRIRTDKDLNRKFIRNVKFLEDFILKANELSVEDNVIRGILKVAALNPGITLNNFLELEDNFKADDIYSLLILGELYIDTNNEVIPDYSARLYINKEYKEAYKNMVSSSASEGPENTISFKLQSGEKLLWDDVEWEIINVGLNNVYLKSADSTTEIPITTLEYFIKEGKIKGLSKIDTIQNEEIELLNSASLKDLEDANKKYNIILPYINKTVNLGNNKEVVTDRTIYNWIKSYRDAEKKFGNGYVGLLSKENKKGNKTQRLDRDLQTLMEKFIQDNYENLKQSTMRSVYLKFEQECYKNHLNPPCYFTFTKNVHKTPRHEQDKKRKGDKAAYNNGEFSLYLNFDTPRHGDRVFEICHIDHTQLDIELVCSITGKNLGRPWLTFLIDAYSRRILALYISFDPPSYRSNMMVLRECVKKHSRFPSTIVVDGGKDFNSVYFDTLLSRNYCTKKIRPGSKPRYGSVIERLFGTTNQMFIYNLTGNTQLTKNVRQVSKNVNPKNLAIWTLEKLYEYLSRWAYEIYDKTEHSGIGATPQNMYENSILKGGERNATRIAYDEVFRILTLPSTRKGTAKVIPGYGVKINRFYYWHSSFRNGQIENTSVQVRYDPFNMGVGYAYINKRWIELKSEKYNVLKNRTEKELNIAFQELKTRAKLSEKKTGVTAKMITDFLNSLEAEEVLLKQRLKDRATRNLFVIEGGLKETFEEEVQNKNEQVINENIKLVVDNTENSNEIKIDDIVFERYEEL
ncbi:TnsA endonuclease N-terminal domain-containing protein [Ornithinibacillus halotolerans]|uniref:Transposase n=1 Tax=Ornithinibacillus halotolerans TaxID=1274357 RepID=A0A916S1G0_9BACI|nr:TnsA endonuclease N-terminal domain-containing protein [Ornithinibacillus halotolerans]GGA77265.1 transposase [Ornithinibacillus halotolerans]